MNHYEGYFGTFDYDPAEFCIEKDIRGDFLSYIGTETDGSKIKIPEGITSCRIMFGRNYALNTPPVITATVMDCDYMFSGCHALEEMPVIPDHVLSVYGMLEGCEKLNGKVADVPEGCWDVDQIGCDYKEHERTNTEGLYPIYHFSCHTKYDDFHNVIEQEKSIGVTYYEEAMRGQYKTPEEMNEFHDNEQGEVSSVNYFYTKEEAEAAAAAAGGDIETEEDKEM